MHFFSNTMTSKISHHTISMFFNFLFELQLKYQLS